jgi:hypothetical protein
MHRARRLVAATPVIFAMAAVGALGALTALAGTARAQQAPPMQSVLAGKKFVPPLKGQAVVEFTAPKTSKDGNNVVTKVTVRNASTAPIARLSITETWYDRAGAVVVSGRGQINELLQPGEVRTVDIVTPWKVGMTSNNYNFAHANGTVKPARVQKLEVPKTPAATPAAAPPPGQ